MRENKFEDEREALSYLSGGSFAAFNFIYQKYSQPVYANICKYVRDERQAEDILQEVFLSLWEHRATIKTGRSVGGWLYTVSYHKSIAVLRSHLRLQMVESAITCHQEGEYNYQMQNADNKETDYLQRIQLLEEAIQCLPEKKQRIYRLSKIEHKKPEEISKELGLTVISVKHYIKQSTRLIKEYVQYKYPVETLLFMIVCLKAILLHYPN